MKAILWIVWIASLVLAVAGLSGLLPQGSWLSNEIFLLGNISSLIGIGIFLGSTLVLLLAGSKASARLLVRLVLGTPSTVRKAEPNSFESGLKQALLDSIGNPESHPGTVIARAVACSLCSTPVWPWQFNGAVKVVDAFTTKVQRSLVLRLLLPDILRSLTDLLLKTSSFFNEFAVLREVKRSDYVKTGVGEDGQQLFSEWVSRKTGALVLADGVHTRSGFPKTIRVLNLGTFRNSSNSGPDDTFVNTHVGPKASCLAETKMRLQEKTLADDFDGRVLDLLATAVVRDPLRPGVELLMITGETCYAATEVDEKLKCKDLVPNPSHRIGFRHDTELRFNSTRSSEERTCLVTVTALVISEFTDEAGKRHSSIVLLRRPKDYVVRNGSDVSAPPGGVVNIDSANPTQSTSTDLHFAIAQELKEEMGLEFNLNSIDPFGVFVVNERGPRGRGQIVATAGFLARTPLSVDQIRQKHSGASTNNGKYESVSYEIIPLPEQKELETLSEDERLIEAKRFATSFLGFLGVIDQRTAVACLYLAADLFGKSLATKAFDEVWKQSWQNLDWAVDSFPGSALGRLATIAE